MPTRNGFVCLASNLCESRYRRYVFSYVTSLLLGSIFYDRATQLDRAILVLGLYMVNFCCWLLLAASEPSQVPPVPEQISQSFLASALQIFSSKDAPPPPRVYLQLSGPTKTALASIAGATIALPSSLPFAIFSLDFGKEGAAVLSAFVSAVSMVAAFIFLRAFPFVRERKGWFGVHGCLAGCAVVAASAMGTVMLSDYRKFSRGYIIQSSLANTTVVTLHACSRSSCASQPMWRPGSRRVWTSSSGRGLQSLRAHVPNRFCHNCGYAELVECQVENSASEVALFTPFERCSEWIQKTSPLRKPKGGWAFSDPLRYPLAPEATYGDRKAYVRRLEEQEEGEESSEPKP